MTLSSPIRNCARLGLATGVLALATGCSHDAPEQLTTSRAAAPSAAPPAGDSIPIHRVADAQIARFALLRSPPEGLPGTVRRVLRRPTYGMNWSFAQRVRAAPGGAFWLVPGRDALCLLHIRDQHEITSACASTQVALAHGVVAASLQDAGPPRRLIVGILPDGSQRATVRTGAVTTTVPVTHGLLVLRDARREPPDEIIPVFGARRPPAASRSSR